MVNELAESLEPAEKPEAEAPAADVPRETNEEPQQEQEHEQDRSPEDKRVPLAALHEERTRRKELQAELMRTREEQAAKFATLEQRLAMMYQAQAAAQAPKVPSFEEDPLANMRAGVEMTHAELQRVQSMMQRQQADTQQRQYVDSVQATVGASEQQFYAQRPDYFDAVKHLKGTRIAQLVAVGMPEQDAAAQAQNEAWWVAENALRNGRNPAQVAYEMALSSGYSAKAVTPAQKMDTLQKGVEAAKSLGTGGRPDGKPTVDQVANMSEDDFDDFIKSGGWSKLAREQA